MVRNCRVEEVHLLLVGDLIGCNEPADGCLWCFEKGPAFSSMNELKFA